MARYLVTSGSKFEPYSYDELVKPLAQATEAHKETQAAYDELAANAESVGALIGEGPENEMAKKMYDDYSQMLDGYIDDLSNNGYGMNAARGLTQLRRKYGSEITSIQNAIARRRELGDEYRKRMQTDPTLITEYDPSTRGLDNWLENPEFGGYRSVSGAVLEKLASDAATNFKQVLSSEANTRNWMRIPGGNFEAATFTGATPEQIEAAKIAFASGTVTGDKIIDGLADIMNSVYNSSGVTEWGDKSAKLKAAESIARGINSALGTVKFDTIADHTLSTRSSSGGGGGGNNIPATAEPFQTYYTDKGIVTTNIESRKKAQQADSDLALIEKAKQRIDAGEDPESVMKDLKIHDSQRRETALTSSTTSAGATQSYYTYVNNRVFGDMLKDYGLSKDATIDDLNEAIHQYKAQMAARESLAWNFQHNHSNVASMVGSYFDSVNTDDKKRRVLAAVDKDLSTFGGGSINKKQVKDAVSAVKEALHSDKSRFAIDPVNGRVVVDYGGTLFSINPDIFYPFNAAMDKNSAYGEVLGKLQRAVANGDVDAATADNMWRDFNNIFINRGGDAVAPLDAPDAIRALSEWNRTYYAQDPVGIQNTVLRLLWGGIQAKSTSAIPYQTDSADPMPDVKEKKSK